jgi:hypothetical protein
VVAEIEAPAAALMEAFRDLPGVETTDVQPLDGAYQRVTLSPKNGVDLRPVVFGEARARGWTLRELTRGRRSLEDIFVHLTRGKVKEE